MSAATRHRRSLAEFIFEMDDALERLISDVQAAGGPEYEPLD